VGINFAIVFGHGLDAAAVLALPGRFSSSVPVRSAANDLHAALTTRWGSLKEPAWAWDPMEESRVPSSASDIRDAWDRRETTSAINGGAGFRLYVGPRAIRGVHIEKVGAVVQDFGGMLRPLRCLVRAMAAEVGGDRAIYVPDSAVTVSLALDLVARGLAMDEITSRLRQDFGAPLATIAAMWIEDERGVDIANGYVVDDFADLP
jgi:hypothetical protein